jgi:hypothetical protein
MQASTNNSSKVKKVEGQKPASPAPGGQAPVTPGLTVTLGQGGRAAAQSDVEMAEGVEVVHPQNTIKPSGEKNTLVEDLEVHGDIP